MAIPQYRVLPGPEGYLPPAAASMGVVLPRNKDEALLEGAIVTLDEAMQRAAEKLLCAKRPYFFPGPLVLWNWKEGVADKARAVIEMAKSADAGIIPMPDYRPKYPMINPAVEINPNHPNLTIWHNKIDVCVFVGVHCHFANLALKIIRGGTDCYTIALCAEMGHEDAMISFRELGLTGIKRLTGVLDCRKGECRQ
ncbi:MAG TPA: carbon monoxide dehydrogenase beta subunit family protein [Atribacteraceae bacterium]|nr:carbon monoxide dehydrogenase beta subunit family protein [Atribacteraceae bacterium]